MKLLFRLLARLPLALNHAVGAFAGRLVYRLSPRYRHRVLDNLAQSGLCATPDDVRRTAHENAGEIGKGASELAWALFRAGDVAALVVRRMGWEAVERLRAENRPIIFVTPHLGGYDVAGRYLWTQVPILAMYRPHKIFWIDELLREGRNAGAAPDGTNVAPATLAGVRMVLKHLRRGGCSVLLPDQVPGLGEGEWADFFGRPAYTMTLLGRLQEASGAAIVFCFAERLARGEGYVLHLEALPEPLPQDRGQSTRLVNAMVEKLVRSCPTQFLWGYNRYSAPRGRAPAAMKWLRSLGSWIGVFVLWLTHFLPMRWIGALGACLGWLLYQFGRGHVTRVNLAFAFPEIPEAERDALGLKHFKMLGRNAVELSIMVWGSERQLLDLIHIEGLENLKAASAGGRPVIVLAPHFIGLNMGGIRIAHEYPGTASIYSKQKNPVLDRIFLTARTRFGDPYLVSRQEGLRSVIRVIKTGKPFYFLPDMDFGIRDAIFSPFFGVPTATITALPRLAKLTNALVVPIITRQVGDGYVARIYPAWENYPTGDMEADVRRMNAFIEDRVREMPEQYFWAHKRFKTRPPGEPNPYRKT